MIINSTCVKTNGLGQHKKTSMLNCKTKRIVTGSVISLPRILERIKLEGLWETGIVFPLSGVVSGNNYSSIIKELKMAHTVTAT